MFQKTPAVHWSMELSLRVGLRCGKYGVDTAGTGKTTFGFAGLPAVFPRLPFGDAVGLRWQAGKDPTDECPRHITLVNATSNHQRINPPTPLAPPKASPPEPSPFIQPNHRCHAESASHRLEYRYSVVLSGIRSALIRSDSGL